MKSKLTPPKTSLAFGIVPQRRQPGHESGEIAPVSTRQPKILVVDADQTMHRLMGTRLGAANYSVQSVDTAQAALDACVRSRPNLVITDLRLDDMGGIPFLRELKSRWSRWTVSGRTGHGT